MTEIIKTESAETTATSITEETIEHDGAAAAIERDALIEKMMAAVGGAFEIFTIYIGNRLGLYDAMADAAGLTSTELADRAGAHERYIREWLEQQTVVGVLACDNPDDGPLERRFRLPAGHAEVLVEKDSLNYLAPLSQAFVGAVSPIEELLEAFRHGGGVPYQAYGANLREGQAGFNRAMFLQQLGSEWIPAMPDVHDRLRNGRDARVADIGCGAAWSSIGIAQAYPTVRVDGFDLDAPSVELAQDNVRAAGLADRVDVQVRDAGDPDLAGRYDLVTAFECLHDMSDPVSALRTMRRLAGDTGTVLVVDERVGEHFAPDGNDMDWMMYGWSVLHCLPVGMADQPAAGTGTVMRPDTVRQYAREAGFREVEILPIDNDFFRFYRLHV